MQIHITFLNGESRTPGNRLFSRAPTDDLAGNRRRDGRRQTMRRPATDDEEAGDRHSGRRQTWRSSKINNMLDMTKDMTN
jgi:hypothetical protein